MENHHRIKITILGRIHDEPQSESAPAVIRYSSKIPKDHLWGQIVTITDWFPTVLGLCGIKQDSGAPKLDGHSLSSILSYLAIVAFAAAPVTMAGDSITTKGIIDPSKLERPADAIILVGPNGHTLAPEGSEPTRWVYADGVLTASPVWDSLLTKDTYRDFRMHVEFNVNEVKDAKDPEADGNSGIYIQQRYEIQILNSFGVSEADYRPSYCGSIYRQKKPDRLVSKKAGEWQSYDIVFRAARFEGAKKIESARITVYQNEQLIHDDYAITGKTGAGEKEGPEPRPIKLQGHHNPVRFRNVWIQNLLLDPKP